MALSRAVSEYRRSIEAEIELLPSELLVERFKGRIQRLETFVRAIAERQCEQYERNSIQCSSRTDPNYHCDPCRAARLLRGG